MLIIFIHAKYIFSIFEFNLKHDLFKVDLTEHAIIFYQGDWLF